MVNKKYKIKGVEDNDELLYIGTLFRPSYKADWHIQVRFKKSKVKSVLASLIPDLAVGRLYNQTESGQLRMQTTSFQWRQIVGNKSGKDLELEPIDGINRNERYLLVTTSREYIAIPQLELARVLFLQNSKMFHYALEPTSLAIDFHAFIPNSENLVVQVNPSAQLSKSQFERIFNVNKLAYSLGDKAGRDAFLSIHANFIKYRRLVKNEKLNFTTWWTFAFEAPVLEHCGVKAKVIEYNGNFQQKPVKIVSEITGLSKVPHTLPENVQFISQEWMTTSVRNSSEKKNEEHSSPDYFEIDDQQSASTFLPARIVESKGTSEFSLEPSRSANTLTKSGKIRLVHKETESEISTSEIANTDLPDILGTAVPVVTSSNTSDMTENSVFDSFKGMIELIEQKTHFELSGYETKPLSKVGYSRLHLKKPNGAPRLSAIAHLRDTSTLESFTLIEVDVSDYGKKKPLSTLLFKYGCLDEARSRVDAILFSLVEKSLNWPREFLKRNRIKSGFINHPQGLNSEHLVGEKNLLMKWANNSIAAIRKI